MLGVLAVDNGQTEMARHQDNANKKIRKLVTLEQLNESRSRLSTNTWSEHVI